MARLAWAEAKLVKEGLGEGRINQRLDEMKVVERTFDAIKSRRKNVKNRDLVKRYIQDLNAAGTSTSDQVRVADSSMAKLSEIAPSASENEAQSLPGRPIEKKSDIDKTPDNDRTPDNDKTPKIDKLPDSDFPDFDNVLDDDNANNYEEDTVVYESVETYLHKLNMNTRYGYLSEEEKLLLKKALYFLGTDNNKAKDLINAFLSSICKPKPSRIRRQVNRKTSVKISNSKLKRQRYARFQQLFKKNRKSAYDSLYNSNSVSDELEPDEVFNFWKHLLTHTSVQHEFSADSTVTSEALRYLIFSFFTKLVLRH